jgi:hypothetical protein
MAVAVVVVFRHLQPEADIIQEPLSIKIDPKRWISSLDYRNGEHWFTENIYQNTLKIRPYKPFIRRGKLIYQQ